MDLDFGMFTKSSEQRHHFGFVDAWRIKVRREEWCETSVPGSVTTAEVVQDFV
jgi:hypothetical protein